MQAIAETDTIRTDLTAAVHRLPREPLARLPTPLDELPNFSRAIGDVRVLIKREDMTGLAFGGNKSRELDFFIGAAKAEDATVFIAGGGVAQSNHAVQCAAAARRADLTPVVVLHGSAAEHPQGNEFLTQLLEADVRFVQRAKDVDAAIDRRNDLEQRMREIAAEYQRAGQHAYVLPSSFHPLGAVAYVECALELTDQLERKDVAPKYVYLTSAGATQAGLLLAAKALGDTFNVVGISYTTASSQLPRRLATLANQAAELLSIDIRVTPNDIINRSNAGPGYGVISPEAREAIQLLATTEGMFVDPVYSGKGLAGLIHDIRSGQVPAGETVVFVHTGGTPALFAYASEVL